MLAVTSTQGNDEQLTEYCIAGTQHRRADIRCSACDMARDG